MEFRFKKVSITALNDKGVSEIEMTATYRKEHVVEATDNDALIVKATEIARANRFKRDSLVKMGTKENITVFVKGEQK